MREKKENYFAYEEASNGKVRQLHDNFGEAYQEYFLEGSGSKESCFYRYQRCQTKHY